VKLTAKFVKRKAINIAYDSSKSITHFLVFFLYVLVVLSLRDSLNMQENPIYIFL